MTLDHRTYFQVGTHDLSMSSPLLQSGMQGAGFQPEFDQDADLADELIIGFEEGVLETSYRTRYLLIFLL